MQTTLARVALTLAILSWTVLPAAAQNREHQQMSAELRQLQEQTQQIGLTLAQLGEALKAINSRMDATDLAAQKRFADQELLIKRLGDILSAVSERTQDTDTRLRKLADEIDALRSTVTSLPSLLSAPVAPAPTETSAIDPGAPVGVPPTAAPTPSTVGLSPSRMLETARSDYFAGSYASALTGFDALLKAFPRTEAAAEAQYMLGETYSALKRFNEAVTAYNTVIQNYPRSSQVPESYYKRGKAQELLGQPDAARASYEQLIKSYPETPSAGLARQTLDRLARQAAPTRP